LTGMVQRLQERRWDNAGRAFCGPQEQASCDAPGLGKLERQQVLSHSISLPRPSLFLPLSPSHSFFLPLSISLSLLLGFNNSRFYCFHSRTLFLVQSLSPPLPLSPSPPFSLSFRSSDSRLRTPLFVNRCRANLASIGQSRPDSGLGFQDQVLKPLYAGPSLLGSGLSQPKPHMPLKALRGSFKSHFSKIMQLKSRQTLTRMGQRL